MANPVTQVTRPVSALLAQAEKAITEAGITSEVYKGTTYKGLAAVIPPLLVKSHGFPVAVICYGGSRYGNSPRRESLINVLILQGHTRAQSGTADVIQAAQAVISSLDDVIFQEVDGEYPITDHWKVTRDEVLDIDGMEAAACIVVEFTVEDY